LLYVGLGILYLFLLIFLGVRCIKGGHWVLFVIGFIFPVLWIIGGVIPPKGMSRIDSLYEQREKSA
jgi:hypothetical protein